MLLLVAQLILLQSALVVLVQDTMVVLVQIMALIQYFLPLLQQGVGLEEMRLEHILANLRVVALTVDQVVVVRL